MDDLSSELSEKRDTLREALIRILFDNMYLVSTPNRHVIDALWNLESLPKPRNLEDLDETSNHFQELVSLGKKLKLLFQIPNQQIISNITPTPNPNQVVAAFIDFLLLMLELFLRFEIDPDSIACFDGSTEILWTELGFLIAFLGDTAMHLQPAKNILIDIEAVVNEVGSFFYSVFFTSLVFSVIPEKEEMTDMETMVNEVRRFLHSDFLDFLEDTTTEMEEIKNAITDIKALFKELGSLFDFFNYTGNHQVPENGIIDLALSNLLPKFELLKTKIKEHCITVSKMPSDMAPNTSLVSLFIVDSVLDDLMHLINNNSERIVGLNNQIITLHEELMSLGSSITVIAVQQEAEHEELVIRTRDIAYEVEYVINSFPPVWYLTLRLPQLIEKIQLIRMSIQEIKNKLDVAGVLEVPYQGEQVSSQSEEPPILEDIAVGFNNMEIKIVEQLVRGTLQLQNISISGMPGLGKTTFASKVYNNLSVVCHFDVRASCVISQTYNKKRVLIDILSSMEKLDGEEMNMDGERLGQKLYQRLIGRRYLIFMDDIWDIKVWHELKKYFPPQRIGSRILFTTRNKEVRFVDSPTELPFLSKDECWELLQRKVFKDENCPQQLLKIGKKIAANCGGLPLAVVVIAGVLANMEKTKHLWKKFARNLSSHISQTQDKSIQLLELSYKHLPMHLRPCFLYFGAFEEDMEIPVRKLISLWVSEGFVKKEEQKTLEDVALGYLMKLIDRSLVLVAKRRFDGGVKTCKIHDLLRVMCSRIAENNNFLKVIQLNYDDPLGNFGHLLMYQQHHHLSINYNDADVHSLPFGLHVRSLLCSDLESPTSISGSFKVVRVLDFFEISDDHIVIGIDSLVNLRYLTISGILPPMERFYRLECLVVDTRDEVEIPDILLSMPSLRHMHFLGGGYFSASSLQQATNDESFQIHNNLQSIFLLKISGETDGKILRCSPNLHRLKVSIRSSLNFSFDFLNQLDSLKLVSDDLSSRLIHLPINLKQLTLAHTRMSPEQMEIIEKLEYLEVLKLQTVDVEGNQWDTSEGGFPQLKFLKLHRVEIVEWNTSSDHFPNLRRLVLHTCKRLKMIPSCIGNIQTLEMIEVYRCTKAVEESAKQIQEEQQDNGNEDLKFEVYRCTEAVEESAKQIQEEQQDIGNEDPKFIIIPNY